MQFKKGCLYRLESEGGYYWVGIYKAELSGIYSFLRVVCSVDKVWCLVGGYFYYTSHAFNVSEGMLKRLKVTKIPFTDLALYISDKFLSDTYCKLLSQGLFIKRASFLKLSGMGRRFNKKIDDECREVWFSGEFAIRIPKEEDGVYVAT